MTDAAASPSGATTTDAATLIGRLAASGRTIACAESLTGGLLAATLVDVPGASKSFVGGIVAYTAALKRELLGVPKALLDREGFVSAEVALRMARGARKQLGADVAVATTGVAGPDVDEWGTPVGTGFVAVAGPKAGKAGEAVRELHFRGDRNAIRRRFVNAALDLLREDAPEHSLRREGKPHVLAHKPDVGRRQMDHGPLAIRDR